jgi:hypothetical protein
MCLTLSLTLEEPGSNMAGDYFVAFLRLSSASNYTTTVSFHILSNSLLSNHPNHVHYTLNRVSS